MLRFKSLTNSPRAILSLALLLTATFGAACGGATPSSTSSSSPTASSSARVGEAFEGEVTSKMFIGDQTMETRYAIKGTRNRIETNLPQNTAGARLMQTSVTLMDLSSGTTTMLLPQTKTYLTMNWAEMAEEMSKGDGKDSSIDFPKVTSTGKTETIAGFTCEHWLIGDKTDVCMAKGLGYFGGGGSGGILDKLKNLALREKIKAQLDTNPEFAKFVEGGAFPLKMAQIENGQSKTIMEVTGIERKSLDDSLFTVPADYRKTEIPGMPGMPGMPGAKR
ncbi:MAG TPA: DUF4412 domain-containing protein [Blastocatellia bacterium]|nr:DUF4412 domain-containing protein [Blastocatellia bacterium]